MTSRLPGLSGLVLAVGALCAAAAAQSAAADPAPASPPVAQVQAEQLLRAAIATLERYDSIRAKVRHRVELFGHKIEGSGAYLQAPPRQHLSRLELSFQIGDSTSTLLQVCDGRALWSQQQVLGETKITRVDLDRVQESLELSSRSRAAMPLQGLALGGLPRLLRGVQASFRITYVQDANLGALPVRVLNAAWRPEKLLILLVDQKREIEQGRPVDLSKLPEHVPDRVLLYLGRDDLFPYRIEYRRSKAAKRGQPADTAGRALATMEFYEVQANLPLDPRAFIYDPGTSRVGDATDEFLTDRGLPPSSK